MYLVFIAMLAMNMSKEVLSAFGFMKDKLVKNNESITLKNDAAYTGLAEKAVEQATKYAPLKEKADKIQALSTDFYAYLDDLKSKMTEDIENKKDYESMDKTDFLDNFFFKGDGLAVDGQAFLDKMNSYRTEVVKELDGYDGIITSTKERFNTNAKKDKEGITIPWLDYHYKGFPLVASLTNLTQIQADIKATESEVLTNLMQGQLKSDVSMTNYDAMVIFDKNAYYAGEKLSGRIVLGKNDPTLLADKVTLNGKEVPKSKIKAGQVILDGPAGGVGDHTLKGTFYFKEGDSTVSIPINGSYAVIPKPNEAVVSADKMNVVYKGLSNPLTISIPGIASNKVKATAPGLRQVRGSSYMMRPTGSGQVSINVSGTLPDGTPVRTSKKFRIKDIPPAMGMVRGKFGTVRMPKSSIGRTVIAAGLPDFLFDLKLQVLSFKVKVPNQPTAIVSGTRFNAQAKRILSKAKRGDMITIFAIKAKVSSSSYRLKKVLPVIIEVSN